MVTKFNRQKIDDLLHIIDDRIEECKGIIKNTKMGLDRSGNPTTSAPYIRTSETKEMQILSLVKDLLLAIPVDCTLTINAMGLVGLNKLVYPIQRHRRKHDTSVL